MNRKIFIAANTISVITHAITQPIEMVRIRSQMLQEGEKLMGIGTKKDGIHSKFLKRSTKQVADFFNHKIFLLLIFLWQTNKDPRRIAKPDYMVFAGLAGGYFADVVTNPIDIVFSRMQINKLYPIAARRIYANLFDEFLIGAKKNPATSQSSLDQLTLRYCNRCFFEKSCQCSFRNRSRTRLHTMKSNLTV
ncbi:UNKNOWN [Stylonychia lemnae]|uniref:Uncharacterized protein n=1 Tax=Stylonychia lemnae TaxID=5949 RepID=A0A077ZR48_STYLE|nr:UNKNOWN [Stylonychia lemnae]|eukprot:CDW72367.1 UNKNOWN [Stylonychia lemnae]